MSAVQSSLLFLSVPDLKSLCCVTLSLHDDYDEPRSKQISTCRELVLLFTDVLAAPALDTFTEITAVMSVQFFHRGIVQSFIQRHCLQMSPPQQVHLGILQICVSFSIISRLSPNWNKAGLYLIKGRDFVTERGRLTAVSMEVTVAEGKLCMSLQPNTVRLPPNTLQDLKLPPLVLRRFCSDPDSVLDLQSTGGAMWCYVLPSLKMGQILSIGRKLPRDGPFQLYSELQTHWIRLYGYQLPDAEEDQVVYCSVYFKPVGPRLFTYPLCCIRLSPVQRCPRVDLEEALSCFVANVREILPSVCGFPTRLLAKSAFTTTALSPASRQVPDQDNLNLTESCRSRAVLTLLPPPPPSPPPPPPAPRPMKPVFDPQPPPLFSRPSSLTPSFSDFFKPASSLNTFFTVFESPSSLPTPTPQETARFVPVFRSKQPLRERKERAERITLPTVPGWQTSFRSAAFLQKVPSGAQTSATVRRVPSLSPENRGALILVPDDKWEKEGQKAKPVVKFNLEEMEQTAPKPSGSSKKGVLKKSALKNVTEEKQDAANQGEEKSKASKSSRDVEKMAKKNQLSRVSSSRMLQFLKARGVNVQNKLPKDQLMLKVMACLVES